ncbi:MULTISPECIES: GNAT family N-acetyltransferase [unclassified Psychrobacter]|uniref:GNAT family N-acetyltransferase n=1 Tax=unclassified Psychrobacter TaxID=196806 RepID=UPI000C32A6CA|nr:MULTISPECIES: GNAT family N-acetyltransferase [unclassified Psychrobacter]MBA6243987.1 GNAT family N-acetyltransferase [Psychrobacter sp. Urea-trap-18]MBA6287203.1 GNAT family N-acetyltransferase [Psychrobacter sp. Urea-trap-16]MBA6318317.1 GNAT family N-acetyltransferase [Psychrobacter sp. Urea-trap-20]MBA6335261.1 GNAT family N-acetyltransferase [Psychrobacter sp. Urea-trap-19]PKG60353.1 GNAT family N-acetyltransferase [Psychrobacter sp. Choline-3u-12]
MSLEYALINDTSWQSQTEWQTPDTPFMSFAFWQALTDTGAIGEQAGWLPIFILVHRVADAADSGDSSDTLVDSEAENTLQPVAVMPVFIKGHHRGEFVFDHAWAEAYARYGVDYYPRLVTSAPYTPITGQRIWLAKGEVLNEDILKIAIEGIDDISQQVGASSWHGLFVTPELASIATTSMPTEIDVELAIAAQESGVESATIELPILERQGCQFLWQNKDLLNDSKPFADFDAFLMTLKAKKRKTIRAERRKVTEQGISCQRKCGDAISDADWKAFYHCYVMTYAVRGQQPYLTIDFFMALAASMPEHIMLAQALDASGEIIASSLFLYDRPDSNKAESDNNATLYGRYWGALGEYDSLHFELCYYQGIEFAIEQGLISFDPGTQGEHKLVRGFIPTTTHSLHRIYDPRFVPAIADFCRKDRLYMAQYRQQAFDALPFNADNMPQFDGNK